MRLFAASPIVASRSFLIPALRDLVHRSQGLLRAVPHDSQHLTHVFIGECDLAPEAFAGALAPVAARPPVPIRLGSARVFPARGRPRLICLDVVENAEAVVALSAAVLRCLCPLLPALDDYRPKQPHVTLARFNRRARPADAAEARRLVEVSGLGPWSSSETLRTVEIVRSRLEPRGARYTTLSSIQLDG